MSEEKKDVRLVVQDGVIGAGDNLSESQVENPVSLQEAQGNVRANPGPIYLRLEAVYEGDVPVSEQGKSKQAFMMLFKDLDGETYMCPVFVEPNFWDATRRTFQRLRPIIFGDAVVNKYTPAFSEEPNHAEDNTPDQSGVGEQDGTGTEPTTGAIGSDTLQ
jgi:hypothetical protein